MDYTTLQEQNNDVKIYSIISDIIPFIVNAVVGLNIFPSACQSTK